jgi:CRISPR/Cas system-associated protein endoribonuclease Cas2
MGNPAISPYKVLWLQLQVSCPSETRKGFLKTLKGLGFDKTDTNTFVRHCANREALWGLKATVKDKQPPHSKVNFLYFTDKQFGDMEIHYAH